MNKRPKILFLVTQSDSGGAQTYVRTLARAFHPEADVTVCAGPDGGGALFSTCKASGIPFRELPTLRRRASRPLTDLRAVWDLRKLSDELKPDIIHANSSKAGVLMALALSFGRNRPKLVYTVHGFAFLEPISILSRGLYFVMEWLSGHFRDATIVLSKKEESVAIRQHLAKPGSVRLIPLGIPSVGHDRTKARERLVGLGVPSDRTVVGTIANFFPSKNLPALVRAFQAVRQTDPRLHLVLIGDGMERPRIEEAVRQNPDGIHLLGFQPNARTLLDGLDLFVLASVKEGLPFSLLEAMEASLPCLATDVGGIPEVIQDGTNGYLVRPENLTDGLVRALSDRANWSNLGANARETVLTNFSEEQLLSKTRALYQSLLAS